MANSGIQQLQPQMPQILSPSNSGRKSSSSNSPEFEFWMLRNPSFPQPDLLSADQLFSGGVLLPLHLLHQQNPDHPPDQQPGPPDPEASIALVSNSGLEPGSGSGPSATLTGSKRWKDIFKKSDRKVASSREDKEKKKERKGAGAGTGVGTELNINIWPFSRSRSAGNGGGRPRAAATRKVTSAPCSRSNSAGESKSRKWPSSPSRGGVHLGRSSPVWQARRGGHVPRSSEPVARQAEKGINHQANEPRRSKTASATSAGGGAKPKVVNPNLPMCIGYRHHLSCSSDENSAVGGATCKISAPAGSGGAGTGEGGRGSNMFNLRSLFTKKVY
ncbi:hypothetical protein RJ639_003070 [Escallonia herrerae]|uniref:Uncharacterized protein n=1 Tax=Escallonia herrerae TaxID=1293975 RepID=A0AA89AUT5_9ASTE|nr:hypothetical protein RJ639_003070 [Escallonia herrerae]